ncbi:MAG: hypothetical protein AAFR28_19185 [Pseudomonadota bacterium]
MMRHRSIHLEVGYWYLAKSRGPDEPEYPCLLLGWSSSHQIDVTEIGGPGKGPQDRSIATAAITRRLGWQNLEDITGLTADDADEEDELDELISVMGERSRMARRAMGAEPLKDGGVMR